MGRSRRRGGSWLSIDLPVEPESPMALVVTCYIDIWYPHDPER